MELVRLLIAFLVLFLIFGLIEYMWPAIDRGGRPLLRKGFRLDFIYWLFNPIVTKSITTFVAVMIIFSFVRVSGMDFDQLRAEGFGPVSRQPAWLIIPEMLLLGDFIGYWIHRAFHSVDDLWDIHAIHHSSTELDWLSSVRVHPLNDLFSKSIRVIPLVLLGFPLAALAAYLPILILLAILVHANVPWRFGPFRYVIASPFFHRWHHTSAEEGLNTNFAGLFPFIDWIFGTLYLPDHQPRVFGVKEEIPPSFLKQLVYPFTMYPFTMKAPQDVLVKPQ